MSFTRSQLSEMSLRKKLAVLRSRGVELDLATSHGGGNRDHTSWSVEFRGPGVPRGYQQVQVRCQTYSGRFDGKRACEREAKEIAVDGMLFNGVEDDEPAPAQQPAVPVAPSVTRGPWKIERKGWVNSAGEFVLSSPNVDIYPAWEGSGCRIPVAMNLRPADAEAIVAAMNSIQTV